MLAVTPACVWWWFGQRLARTPDDPLLPERLIELRRRTGYVAGAAGAALAFGWFNSLVWALPLVIGAQFVAGYPLRRALYRETWGPATYFWFQVRLIAAFFGFWILLLAAPSIIASAAPFDWAAALTLAALLLAWNHHYVAVVRLLARTRPVDDQSLVADFRALAERAGVTPPAFDVLPTSGGVIPNAVALPSLRGSAVVMTSTAFERLERDEVLAICAHEIAHIEHYHGGLLRRLRLITTALIVTTVLSEPIARSLELPMLTAIVSWTPLLTALFFVLRARSRQQDEIASDLRAVELTGNPEAVVRALTRLHLIALFPRRWDPAFERRMTHPSLARRVQAIRGSVQSPSELLPEPTTCGSDDRLVTFGADSLQINENGGAFVHTLRYEGLRELRIDVARRGQPRLIAADATGRRWAIVLRADDVPRVQSVLDVVDTKLTHATLPSIAAFVPRVVAAMTVFVAASSGQLALLVPALVALLQPASPLVLAAAAGALTTSIAWQTNAVGAAAHGWGPLPLALLSIILAATVWKGRKDALPSSSSRGLTLLGVCAVVPTLLVLLNADDAIRWHRAAREWPWVAVLLVAFGAALAAWPRRLARFAAAPVLASGAATVFIASSAFLDYFGDDAFLASASAFTVNMADSRVISEAEVPLGANRLRLSPNGRHLLFVQMDDDENSVYRIGPPSGPFATHAADNGLFADDDHVVLLRNRRDGVEMRELELNGAGEYPIVWEKRLPSVTRGRFWLVPGTKNWRVIGRRGHDIVVIEGLVGDERTTERAWPIDPDELDDEDEPIDAISGSHEHVVLSRTREHPAMLAAASFGALASIVRPAWSESQFWSLGPAGRRPLADSQLAVDCEWMFSDDDRPLCVSSEGDRSSILSLDLDSGHVEAVGSLAGSFINVRQSGPGWLVGWWSAHGPLAVHPHSREAWRVASEPGARVRSLAATDHALASLTTIGRRAVVRVYAFPPR